MRTRPAAPPTVPARSPRVAASTRACVASVASMAVAVGVAVAVASVLVGVLGAAPAMAAETPRLAIVTPQTGDVVGRSFTIRIQMVGGGAGTAISHARFYVTLDGLVTRGDRVTGSRSLDEATLYTATPSTESVVTLEDVPLGDHRVRVVPLSPGVQAPPPVTVAVRSGTGTGVAGIVVGILLAGLFLLYRRRILNPRMRGMERRTNPSGDDPDNDGDAGGRTDRDRREGWD